jgi:hypothetical protein
MPLSGNNGDHGLDFLRYEYGMHPPPLPAEAKMILAHETKLFADMNKEQKCNVAWPPPIRFSFQPSVVKGCEVSDYFARNWRASMPSF